MIAANQKTEQLCFRRDVVVAKRFLSSSFEADNRAQFVLRSLSPLAPLTRGGAAR